LEDNSEVYILSDCIQKKMVKHSCLLQRIRMEVWPMQNGWLVTQKRTKLLICSCGDRRCWKLERTFRSLHLIKPDATSNFLQLN